MKHVTLEELDSALAHIKAAPKASGLIEMIVRRPHTDEREILDTATFDVEEGLVGDKWFDDVKGSENVELLATQLTLMNARVAATIAGTKDRWALAGDQMYVDLDLSNENLPTGTRLRLGEIEIEVTAVPHTGCSKFAARFGKDAVRFVNSKEGRRLNLRGINAKVVVPGTVRTGENVHKV